MSKTTAPYGTWVSPIDSNAILSKTITFDDVLVDPIADDKTIYHLEERPDDNGRCVIVDTRANKDVLPSPWSARTFVQEYGGAPAIVYNNVIYFSNDNGKSGKDADNSVYTINVKDEAQTVTRITPVNPWRRYANFAIHPKQNNLLVTLREDHTDDQDPNNPKPQNVVNTICVLNTETASVNIIVQGADFYATPVLNPSGTKIAWQQWCLPDMPWQGGIIYVADVSIDSGTLKVSQDHVLVAGKKGTKAATFPNWISDTTLAYTTDGYNKYQNPYAFNTDTQQSTGILKKPLTQDFAEPAWWLGLYPYAILNGGKYGVFTAFNDGRNILYIIDLDTPSDPVLISWQPYDFTVAQHVRAATDNTFVFTSSQSAAPGGIVLGTVSGSAGSYTVSFDILKASAGDDPELDKYISPPIPRTLTASDGHKIYVVYYAPYNPYYTGPSDKNPPCIIGVHGGPTGLEPQALNWTKMYYTSRGFAWLDVNYRGSSGYGREYADLLNGNWGIYDVADCKEAATLLPTVDIYIDETHVAIRGGSAGAYTTLSSLTFAPEAIRTFYKTACGAYGCVADVETLTKATEKFEMRYIYTLFGCPPDNHAWDPRNPIKNVSTLSVPFLILQGLADGVVPPSIVRDFLAQSAAVAPSEEFAFYPGEGHHWHLASTIEDALIRESTWYQKNLL